MRFFGIFIVFQTEKPPSGLLRPLPSSLSTVIGPPRWHHSHDRCLRWRRTSTGWSKNTGVGRFGKRRPKNCASSRWKASFDLLSTKQEETWNPLDSEVNPPWSSQRPKVTPFFGTRSSIDLAKPGIFRNKASTFHRRVRKTKTLNPTSAGVFCHSKTGRESLMEETLQELSHLALSVDGPGWGSPFAAHTKEQELHLGMTSRRAPVYLNWAIWSMQMIPNSKETADDLLEWNPSLTVLQIADFCKNTPPSKFADTPWVPPPLQDAWRGPGSFWKPKSMSKQNQA